MQVEVEVKEEVAEQATDLPEEMEREAMPSGASHGGGCSGSWGWRSEEIVTKLILTNKSN